MMADKLPLVVYRNGKRIVVGDAEIEGDHISAQITDPVMIEKLSIGLEHVSIGFDEASIIEGVKPKRRNVFEQDKD